MFVQKAFFEASFAKLIINLFTGHPILDDVFGIHSGCSHNIAVISASLHETQIDFKLRIFKFTLQSSLSTFSEYSLYVPNDFVYFSGCLRTSASIESW